MTEHRNFRRSFGSLAEIFAFSADFFARHGVDAGLLSTVDFTLEELFTNMVKYSPAGDAHVRRTLEDTPFYARSVVSARFADASHDWVHESLSLDRFANPLVRLMLPFRMPRRA